MKILLTLVLGLFLVNTNPHPYELGMSSKEVLEAYGEHAHSETLNFQEGEDLWMQVYFDRAFTSENCKPFAVFMKIDSSDRVSEIQELVHDNCLTWSQSMVDSLKAQIPISIDKDTICESFYHTIIYN